MKHPKCKRDPEMNYGTRLPEHLFMILSKSRSAVSPHLLSQQEFKAFFTETMVSVFTGLLVPLVMWGLWEKTLKISSHSFLCFANFPESQSTSLAFTWVNLVLRLRRTDQEDLPAISWLLPICLVGWRPGI